MTREEWNNLTPDEQYAIYVVIEKKLELLQGKPIVNVPIPQNAGDADKLIQDAWDQQ